jgi:uncharacterized protein YecT (DUF1311 family)
LIPGTTRNTNVMKKMFVMLTIHLSVVAVSPVYAQDGPREVTPEIEKKITEQVAQGATKLKARLMKGKDAQKNRVEFQVDTFRIEEYERLYLAYDYSTAGMNDAAHAAADKYDQLLNKYYKLLLSKLDKPDKDAAVQAQRAWVAFRDREIELESTLEAEKYSGGGTLQVVRHASFFEELIRKRAIEIFEYYDSVGN